MFQNITIVGNLGNDPEMRYMPDGTAVTNLNVATNRRYNDRNGERREETTWFRVAVWGPMAESCNTYLLKGRQVLVEGRLVADPATGGPRIWTRQDGSAGASFEIRATNVTFLGQRSGEPAEEEGNSTPLANDDIPF